MRTFEAECRDGTTEVVEAWDIHDFPYHKLTDYKCRSKKKQFYESFMTLDIETTTIPNYNDTDEPLTFMWHWQATIQGICVYGRTYEEYFLFLDKVYQMIPYNAICPIVCYVFNLGFEFQFFRNRLKQLDSEMVVFAAQTRKPITVRLPKVGIEYRCAWKLTNMSLAKACENTKGCKYLKRVGDLDYRKFRTPLTPVDDTEFSYNMGDVLCLHSLIEAKLNEENDNLCTIPLTSTGYVRRYCRTHCLADPHYWRKLQKILPDQKVIELLFEASRGGDTHANRHMAAIIYHDAMSFDKKSSYPFQMLTKPYPIGKFTPLGTVKSFKVFESYCKKYCCIFHIAFKNLRLRKEISMPYLPESKQIEGSRKSVIDNGRVIKNPATCYTITEVDYWIVKDQYTWDAVAVSDLYFAPRGLLPEPLRKCVLTVFQEKCKLEVERDQMEASGEQESYLNAKYMYAKIKNRLNGIFGMCYTKPVHEQIVIQENGTWKKYPADISEIEKVNKSRNTFLSYAWGVYTAAWGRYDLNVMRKLAGQEKVIYQDTDSTKGIEFNVEAIEQYNAQIRKLCDDMGITVTIGERKFYIGTLENETEKGLYKEFKTLGAKKYVYTDYKGVLNSTISGVPKAAGAAELKSVDRFEPGFTFTEAGCTVSKFNDKTTIDHIMINGESIEVGAFVSILDSEYTLGITGEYFEMIGFNFLEV